MNQDPTGMTLSVYYVPDDPNASFVRSANGGGVMVVVLGVLFSLGVWVPWLGRLPGDIRIERDGLRVYVPIVSCLLISVLVSVLWLLAVRLGRRG